MEQQETTIENGSEFLDLAKEVVGELRKLYGSDRITDCVIREAVKHLHIPNPEHRNELTLLIRTELGSRTARSVLQLNAVLEETGYYAELEHSGLITFSGGTDDWISKAKSELPSDVQAIVNAFNDDYLVFADAAEDSPRGPLTIECEEIEASGIDDVDFADADSYDVSVSVGDAGGTVVVRVGETVDDYEINESASDLADLVNAVMDAHLGTSEDDAREMLSDSIEEIVFPFVESARNGA